jgi:hypothetical protein
MILNYFILVAGRRGRGAAMRSTIQNMTTVRLRWCACSFGGQRWESCSGSKPCGCRPSCPDAVVVVLSHTESKTSDAPKSAIYTSEECHIYSVLIFLSTYRIPLKKQFVKKVYMLGRGVEFVEGPYVEMSQMTLRSYRYCKHKADKYPCVFIL